MRRARVGQLLLVGVVLAAGACTGVGGTSPDRAEQVVAGARARDRASLTGSGSTFAAPIVEEWISRYRQVAPGVTIDYRRTGSVAGVDQLTSETADFAVSELPLADVLGASAAGGSPAIEVPCIGGGVAIAYNLPGLSALRLSAGTLSAILSGKVTTWDDPAIRADNDGVSLPSTRIRLVRRSDASGTTQALTQFLAGEAPDTWGLGAGPTVAWPESTAAEGSDALIAAVKETTGAIGYAQVHHATRAELGVASIENGAGRFVAPTAESVNAALNGASPEAPGAYPLATISFLVVSPAADEPTTAALRHFATWVLTEGQRWAEHLSYARVPDAFLSRALTTVLAIA